MNLIHLFTQQDNVLRITFIILVIMSILSWSVIILRLIKIIKTNHENQKTLSKITKLHQINELSSLNNDKSEISGMLKNLLVLCESYNTQTTQSNINTSLPFKDYMMLSIQNESSQILRKFDSGLAILASIGSIAPFVGLFGTVWGIFNALMDISQQGQVNIATVSGPIGEALVATAVGLFTAIPAVLAYNMITRLNRHLSQDLDTFSHNIYIYLTQYNIKDKT